MLTLRRNRPAVIINCAGDLFRGETHVPDPATYTEAERALAARVAQLAAELPYFFVRGQLDEDGTPRVELSVEVYKDHPSVAWIRRLGPHAATDLDEHLELSWFVEDLPRAVVHGFAAFLLDHLPVTGDPI